MKSTVAVFVLCLAASAQVLVAPAYSTARVDALANAIARTEGFYARGSKPARMHNPGDLKQNGQYRRFRTDKDGFAALTSQIVRVIEGRSQAYTLDMSIRQVARKYASSPLWPRNVAAILGVDERTTLRSWLCNGSIIDVGPQFQFKTEETKTK